MRVDTSSSDCDESMVLPTPKAKSTPISIKREPVTTTDSSSEEDEPTAPRTIPANHNASSDSGDSSSDEDERLNSTVKAVVKKEPLSQQTSDSSEESDDEVETPSQQKTAQDSSSEDEASNTKTQASMNHSRLAHALSNSEESSDDELPMDRTVSNLKVKNFDRGDSHKEASKASNSGRVQNESSSSEEESDESLNNQPKPTMNGASSSEESDEGLNKHDERHKTQKQLVSASINTQKKHADSSSEDESEEESDESDREGKNIPKTSLKQSPQSSSDSSDESDKEIPSSSRSKTSSSYKSSDVQVKMEIESNLGEQSSSSSDSEDNKWPVNPIHQVRTSILRGSELMKAVFKEHVPVDPMNAQLGCEDITSEDEIWLIQCPKSLDATTLKKQTIDLYGKTSFQTQEGQTFKRYYAVSEPDSSQNMNCVLPSKKSKSFKMFNMTVVGKIMIEEHVHIPKLKPPAVHPKTSFPLPSGLKVRHPLLGIEYKKHIKAAQKSIKSDIKQRKKKKDKTTSASDGPSISGDFNTSSGSGYRTLAEPSTDCVDGIGQFQKKKKKHKSDKFEALSAVNVSSPGKKRRSDGNSITNPNLLNVVVKTEPAVEITNNNHVSDELTRKKQKKSKKENRVQGCGILDLAKNVANGLNNSNDETPKNKKSKKAKHEGVQDSPNTQVSLNSKYQEDFETPKMKKPKKLKYRDSMPLFASEIKQEIVSDETSKHTFNDSETTVRKRKKDRDSSDGMYQSSKKKQKLNDSLSSLNISQGEKKISR